MPGTPVLVWRPLPASLTLLYLCAGVWPRARDRNSILSPFAAVLLAMCGGLVVALPRRRAAFPLLVVTCYLTLAEVLSFGQAGFSVLRIVLVVGVARVVVRGERAANGYCALDGLLLCWAAWNVVACVGHEYPFQELVRRVGQAGDALGVYFLFRVFCADLEDIDSLMGMLAVVLVPVAAEMILELATGRNLFAALGGIRSAPDIREGRLRAQGPFEHAILAGTVGAICLPLFLSRLRTKRRQSTVGLVASLSMIVTSASSGPILTALAALGALWAWRHRDRMREYRWVVIVAYVMLSFVMKDPPYYLIARVDLAGGSTGWHRARLIESSLEHLNEWWLWGTDYTRHWMPTGVSWNPNHTDITNEYLLMGVSGGMLLTVLYCAVLWQGFTYVGRRTRGAIGEGDPIERQMWTLGASLFSIAVTGISVSFFDQSKLFVFVVLAAIAALQHRTGSSPELTVSATGIRSPGAASETLAG